MNQYFNHLIFYILKLSLTNCTKSNLLNESSMLIKTTTNYVNLYLTTDLDKNYNRLLQIYSENHQNDYLEDFIRNYENIRNYVIPKDRFYNFNLSITEDNFEFFQADYIKLSLRTISLCDLGIFIDKYEKIYVDDTYSACISHILYILTLYTQMCYNLRSLYFYSMQNTEIRYLLN